MIKKIFNFTLLLIMFLTCCINVSADEVNYSTKYYYSDTSDVTKTTDFRSGTNNFVTLYGKDYYAPTYDDYEYLTGFDNRINYSVSNGTTYTVKVFWSASGVGIFNDLLVSQRLNGLDFVKSVNGVITYQKTTYTKDTNSCYSFSGDQYCTYNFITTYTFNATSNSSSFRVGTYNNNANSMYGTGNYLTQSVSVYSIDVIVNSDNTIINQNEQIIDQNQTIIDNSNKTNEELKDMNDNITNDNVSGVEESFSQFEDFLDDNSTITQLITLPVTLYSSILQGVSNSCTPFNLGTLYGESLILPCVNIGDYLGSTLWGMIDLIISGFAIYSISKKLIKVFNNFSSMKEGDVIDD